MAHHVEPMDVDNNTCDLDIRDNSLHDTNVLAKGPCTACRVKGHVELEESEIYMELRPPAVSRQKDVTITASGPSNLDKTLPISSSSLSLAHTTDLGSQRGLKCLFSMCWPQRSHSTKEMVRNNPILALPDPAEEKARTENTRSMYKFTKERIIFKEVYEKYVRNKTEVQNLGKEVPDKFAAFSCVASARPSDIILSYGPGEFNIKKQPYLSEDYLFNKTVELMGDDYYKVKDETDFMEKLKIDYETIGKHMNHEIEKAIKRLIEKPIPKIAGIPGLHAEVLALNDQLNLRDSRIKKYKKLILLHNEGHTQVDDSMYHIKEKTAVFLDYEKRSIHFDGITMNEHNRNFYIYTYRFNKRQIREYNKLKEKYSPVEFPACYNCANIINQISNCFIRTGETAQQAQNNFTTADE